MKLIEYVLDTIHGTAGNELTVSAKLTNEDGSIIQNDCVFILHNDDKEIYQTEGVLAGDLWLFSIPKEVTMGLYGRFWYCIKHNDNSLCFKKPFYLR